MKKIITIALVLIVAGIAAGFIYWQYNKRKIVRESLADAIARKTDSLYYLHYDSSFIDEINGNAEFYNVVLQSDSAQKAMLNSTDSLPNALYNIRINQVLIKGVDVAGLLKQQNVAARKIVLVKPVIQIINTGADRPKPFTADDTLELYKKILGKFKSIKADTIVLAGGTLLLTNKAGKALTSLENINITLRNFLVDETKNYQSIISYFIKDVRVMVDTMRLPVAKNDSRIILEKVDYNAAQRYLHISAVKQYQPGTTKPVTNLGNIQVSDVNTDAFIIQRRLKAGQITCNGGVVTIYIKRKPADSKTGDQVVEFSTNIIDQAQIAGISLGSTKFIIADKDNPGKPPFVLNNAHFKVTKMLKIDGGTTITNLINNAEWELSADGFSFIAKNKLYKISVGDFVINNAASMVKIKNFSLTPRLTEKQFVQQARYQADLYNLSAGNIVLKGVNTKRLLSAQELEVGEAAFTLAIKIFNDRNLPPDSSSNVGKYPHQSLLKMPIPIYIHTAHISNSLVSYRERDAKSKLTGNVFFSGINATLVNVTNIPARIKVNALMKLNATASFLGKGDLSTEWQFPLNAGNGAFTITGQLGNMNAADLNPIVEPLAMVSVKTGGIDGVKFTINGADTKATGNILFLYHGLKMDVLKKSDDAGLKKKGLLTLLANTIIKNDNSNAANSKDVLIQRVANRSFFNLVWNIIFLGAKKTAL